MSMDRTETTYVETVLRDELARGNRALRGVAPVIAHMLDATGPALVSDAIVARLRGMLGDLARQLLEASASVQRAEILDEAAIDALADALAHDGAVLDHLYALAMEGQLNDRLSARSAIDPVLSPLLQELIASDDPAVAELAMKVLAAQSRFNQSQRRMQLPLGELPADLFAAVLGQFETATFASDPANSERALAQLKARYDEGAGRLGLLARLTTAMRGGAVAALDLEHAGLGLFASALASLTRQPRDLAVFSCHERQAARLALSLRAAGLGSDAIEAQFLLLGQAETVPDGISDMPAERAQMLLGAGDPDTNLGGGAL